MILIYTHKITERLAYTVELIFRDVLQMPYGLTDDVNEYKSSDLPKLSYTREDPGTGLFLQARGLLFETHIRREAPQSEGRYKHFPIFFPALKSRLLPYDLFATVFYIATRYEEYLPYQADRHGRFQAEESLLYKAGLLETPFLNDLILDFAGALQAHYPGLSPQKSRFRFLSTIDIDNAFAYAHKGLLRNAGGLAKDLLSLKLGQLGERLASNGNDGKDPYNTFERIGTMGRETGTSLQYFVLIGDYSDYDKNPHYQNAGFRKLLKSLSVLYPMGLHPSYRSFDEPRRILSEKRRLEEIIGRPVTSARCHFLRIRFPETYRQFLEAGITDDYTMIYASRSGFRTGLCVPFRWFDLERNEVTALTIHSSAAMEGTLRDYNQLSPAEAWKKVESIMGRVAQHGGEFISIFHNDSFVPAQQAWVELYRKMLSKAGEL